MIVGTMRLSGEVGYCGRQRIATAPCLRFLARGRIAFVNGLRPTIALFVVVSSGILLPAATVKPPPADRSLRFDIVISGGRITDQRRAATVRDVGIRDGRIAAIGSIDPALADELIDADGMALVPGRTIVTANSVAACLDPRWSWRRFLTKGVTTLICGDGPPTSLAAGTDLVELRERSNAEELQLLAQIGPRVNVVPMIGFNRLRNRTLQEQKGGRCQVRKSMESAVREAMAAGTFGVAFAADELTDSVISNGDVARLARIVGRRSGWFVVQGSHRTRAHDVARRTAEIARESGVPVATVDDSLAGAADDDSVEGFSPRSILPGRGTIAVGMAADIVIRSIATHQHESRHSDAKPSSTIHYVLVNGKIALRKGDVTSCRGGRVLRGPGCSNTAALAGRATGCGDERFSPVDSLVQEFLRKHHLPGGAVAITDQGRLVYARGFGFADVDTREPVLPNSLFRIASVSKPITAVAILQLVESGKLDLDAPFLSVLGHYQPAEGEEAAYDRRLNQVTIRQLLQHRGGWDREATFDPMFAARRFINAAHPRFPPGQDEIIRGMLSRPLDFNPGERYAYSNFGYCLLGRVIESLTHQPYEEYVRHRVLQPIGVNNMAIGGTRLAQRRPAEVRYYDPEVGRSIFSGAVRRAAGTYGAWSLRSMDSHGGWIGSAVDLVRFASTFDDPEHCVLLHPSSVTSMAERPAGLAGFDENGVPRRVFYGLGWQVHCDDAGNVVLQMHAGSLPGTSSVLVKWANGRNLAILFNARRTPYTSAPAADLVPHVIEALDQIHKWPQVDYFKEYL